MKLGILVSGSGTNLQALLDAEQSGALGAEIALVISNLPDVKAIDRANAAGKKSLVLPHQDYASRSAFEAALVTALQREQVELVALAGFMRIVGVTFLSAFPGRVLNIHPSLLPAFPGTHAQRQALEHGVKVSGCTVHFVDEGCDTGPIILQAAVPVLDSDDEAALRDRILSEEHRIYPAAIRLVASGQIQVSGHRTTVKK